MMWSRVLVAISLVSAVLFVQGQDNAISIQKICDGFDQPCTIELVEGLDQWISLSLDEPIICPECNDCSTIYECSVVVNFTVVHAPGSDDTVPANEILNIDPCYVRWTKDQSRHTKRVRLSALTSYRHTSKIKLIVGTGVVSRSTYYADRDPGDLYVESIDRGTATCSSVGDPHYTSFDGRYWNYYDSGVTTLYRAIDREFLIQTRTHINQRWPSNSVNCQIGGREGRDLVSVSFCTGQADLITDFNSEDPEKHPVVDSRGSSYSVYFHSGAYFHVSWTGYYMNINVGGIDTGGRSCGLCGDADGNPGNDKTGSLRTVTGLDSCSDSPSIIPGGVPTDRIDSIFDWVYDVDNFPPEKYETPEGGSDCPYSLQSIVKPIVATDDIEDITEQLERLQEDRRNGGGGGAIVILDDEESDDDDADGDDVTDLTGLTDDQLVQQCEAACNQEAVLQCTALYTEFGDQYDEEMDGCKDDIKDMGAGATGGQIDTFLTGINSAIIELCITFVIKNGDETDAKLTQLLCNGAKKGCGDHGTCASNASCICEDNWGGTDCTVDLLTPPGIRAISDLVYDVRGLIPGRSPSEIVIYGTNFHKNNEAVCRWGNPTQDPCTEDDPECFAAMTTRAYYAGVGTFICFVPTFGEETLVDNALFRQITGQDEYDEACEGQTCFEEFEHNGVVPLAMDFAISNNGIDFSDPTRLPFKYFDSKCVNCSASGTCVTRTSGSCVVGDDDAKKCYLEGETREDNECFECLPDVSTTDLVYTFAPKLCKPKFINKVAKYDIFGSAQAGDVIIKGCGDDTLGDDEQCVGVDVSSIDGAEVKYIYEPGADRIDCKELGFAYDNPPVYFTVSEVTGDILLTKDINIAEAPFINSAHGADHPCLFAGDFNVKAQITVGAGNAKRSYNTTLSYTHIIIDLLPADYGAIAFDKGGFNGTIPENSPDGTPVLDLEGKPLIVKLVDDPRFNDLEGNFKWAAQSIVGAFAVNAETGAVTVADGTLVDREARDNGRFNPATGLATSVVEASLGFGYHIEDVRILITNVNEAATSAYANCTDILDPCDYSLVENYFALPENTPTGVNLAVLESVDAENSWDPDNWKNFNYKVTDTEGVFEAVLDQDVWMLRAKKSLNFETDKQSWTIVLTSTDTLLVGPSAEVSTTITIKLGDVNEPPTDPIVTSTNTGVVIDGVSIKISESVPSRTSLASVTSTDPDVGDPHGECSGACGIVVDGVLNIDESSQAACPFFVTNEGNVERKLTLCLDNDNTRSDLAFMFQCTFEGSDVVVEAEYAIVVEDSDSEEAKINTFTPVNTAFIVENQENEGNVERNGDVVLGTIFITEETRDVSDPFSESTDKSRFTFDYEEQFGEPLFVISKFTPSTVDGVVGVTLEISVLQDAFVDMEELACDGCFGPAEDCDGDECQRVPVLMSVDGTSLENCIADDARPFMRVVNTQDPPTGINCGFFDPKCENIHVPENAQVGTSVVNFTVVDDDPSDYAVTLSQGSPFTVTKIATGGERRQRRALYSVYELTVTDVDALLAADGNAITFTVTVEEKGQGGARVTLPLSIAVENVPFAILPLTSLGSPALFNYSYCGFNTVKAYVEKAGISVATHPSALTRYDGTITWSVTYDDVDEAWLTLTPSTNTLEVEMSITPGKTPLLDGEFTLSAISTVPNTDPTAQEFTFAVTAPARYAPKFAAAKYNATVTFQVEDDVESQIKDQNTFPKITVSDFDTTTNIGHKLTVTVVTLAKLSSLDTQAQAAATSAKRLVYKEELCTQTNRYVSAVGYKGAAEVLVWTVVNTFNKTDCTEVFANPESMDCTPVYFDGSPNVNISAGAFSPAFKAGAFIMANWKDTSVAYNTLSSFVPFSVDAVDATEPIEIIIDGEASLGEDNAKGSVGLIVGIVVLLLVCVLIVAAAYFWRQQRKTKHDELFDGKGVSIYDQNPAYAQDNEVLYESNTDWVPGVSNPMYDWYRPDMTRKDCTDHLNQLGEGAYIVRDSDANPGWHMLGVKSQNRVLHDKIRLTENDEYQLLPSGGNAASIAQPTFSDLPELVGYYEQGHDGMEYTLVGSNPIYDNHQLQQERGGTLVKSTNASNLPAKNREYAAVDRLTDQGDDSVGNPLYFDNNNNGDNATYSQADGYLDVKGLPKQGTQGYLDVDPNTGLAPQGTQGYLDVDPVTGTAATGGYMDVPVNPAHDSL